MAKISEIRMLFEAKLKEGIPDPPGPFDIRDLERVKSDKYLYRVLEHNQNNVQDAVNMLFDIMSWRKSIGANEITHESVSTEFLKKGVFFPHGRDIDGCLLFIMDTKPYVRSERGIEEMKKIIIYWLERIEREEDGKKISLFFDMQYCGFVSLVEEVIMFMVTLLKRYYPNMINYVIVFQLTYISWPDFTIIKNILPAAVVDKFRMVNRNQLKEIVAPEQSLVSWGGKDNYVFEFIPENRVNSDRQLKQVSFSEDCQSREMILMNPSKLLIFRNDSDRISSQLTITNMVESCVAFKIRTTAPEKYVVRPNSGTLITKASQTVNIIVNSGFLISSVETDRFLVVAMKIPSSDISQKDLNDLWKSADSKTEEYRLKCSPGDVGQNVSKIDSIIHNKDSIEYKIDNLQINHRKLAMNLDSVKMYQLLTLLFSFVNFILGYYAYKNSKNGCQQ